MLLISFFDEFFRGLTDLAFLLLWFFWCLTKFAFFFLREKISSDFVSLWRGVRKRRVNYDNVCVRWGDDDALIADIRRLAAEPSSSRVCASSAVPVSLPSAGSLPLREVSNQPFALASLSPLQKSGFGCYSLDCVCVVGLPCLSPGFVPPPLQPYQPKSHVPAFAFACEAIVQAWVQEYAPVLVSSAVSSPFGDNVDPAVSSLHRDNAEEAVSSPCGDNAFSAVSSLLRDNADPAVSSLHRDNAEEAVSSPYGDNAFSAVSSPYGDNVDPAVSSLHRDNAEEAVSSPYGDNAFSAVSSLLRDNADPAVSSLHRDNAEEAVSSPYGDNAFSAVSSLLRDNADPAVSSLHRDNAEEAVSSPSGDNAFSAVSSPYGDNADPAVSSLLRDNAVPAVSSLFRDNAEEAVSSPCGDNAFSAVSSLLRDNADPAVSSLARDNADEAVSFPSGDNAFTSVVGGASVSGVGDEGLLSPLPSPFFRGAFASPELVPLPSALSRLPPLEDDVLGGKRKTPSPSPTTSPRVYPVSSPCLRASSPSGETTSFVVDYSGVLTPPRVIARPRLSRAKKNKKPELKLPFAAEMQNDVEPEEPDTKRVRSRES
ncbi:uncharacterized protein EV154DRAFT_483656 [Mucor mucedo]|uniref:uncharacterized protein n=1 Tax=Mucor mucedo TaxID=29922 RepID=UPI0022202266|nr:uncharacterized protein EV154DRAFT_483656 [Mucor mucedo]KAI7888886.1 hypothetical protein EV154DRAFT_483656 [Mucor mucedo]